MASSATSPSVDPVERLLDLIVYAPIGLVSKSADALPELVKRGRARASNARVIGQFALGATNSKARQAVSDAEQHIAAFFKIVADSSSPKRPTTDGQAPTAAESPPVAKESSRDSVDDLIPGYLDMTAAQILPLLAGLSAEQRVRIESFERDSRSRKTILNRLRQLNG